MIETAAPDFFKELTFVVNAGEEAVICELLPDEVQLDAELRNAALIVHEAVTEGVPLPSQASQFQVERLEPHLVIFNEVILILLLNVFLSHCGAIVAAHAVLVLD